MDRDNLRSEIQAIVAAHTGVVHSQDVGPLFGQLAVLAREVSYALVTRTTYELALNLALATEGGAPAAPSAELTRVVTRVLGPRQERSQSNEELAAHQRARNRRRHGLPRLPR